MDQTFNQGQLFAGEGYQSNRYLLVARQGTAAVSGAIIEILARSGQRLSKAAERRLLVDLYQRHRSPGGTALGRFTGFVFFYTPNYRYRTGTRYVDGKAQAGRMRLAKKPATQKPAGPAALGKPMWCISYTITSHDPPYDELICGGGQPYENEGGSYNTGSSGYPNYGGSGPYMEPNPSTTGGGDTGETAFEYIDPSVTFTAGPTPPDVSEYNCAQLRTFHGGGDDPQSQPISLATFLAANANKSRAEIIAQRGYQYLAGGLISLSKGPILRYIRDPQNPEIFIDLRHMLVVGYYGPGVGNSVEVTQGLGGQPSAFDHQDYYSNQLGYDFYYNYGSSVASEPGRFLEFLNEFLTSPTSGRGIPNRSRNTSPALVNQRCP